MLRDFYDIAVAADKQRGFGICHNQHGFEFAQRAIRAPFLCQLYGRASQLALILF